MCNRVSKKKDALASKHLVYRLDTGKRVVIQDGLYSGFAKHVEAVCLEIPHQLQNCCIEYANNNRQDTLSPHEGSALCRG